MNFLTAPTCRSGQSVVPAWPGKHSRQNEPTRADQSPRVTRLCGQERETCEAWVFEHRARLLIVARRILRCEEDALDAVQDAFLSAFASQRRFQGKSQVYTWLHRIVINTCLMKLRSQKTRRSVSLDALESNGAALGENQQSYFKPTERGCELLERAEAKATVHRCLDRLSEDHREIIVLRDIQEFDTDTTARLLGISLSAVKTRLHRARQALRAQLEIARSNVTSPRVLHLKVKLCNTVCHENPHQSF